MHAYEHGHRPQGSPPTLDEHRTLERAHRRPLTDAPTGTHIHAWARRKAAAVSPDILRRLNIAAEGERTPEQAAFNLAVKVISHTLEVTIGEAKTMIRRATEAGVAV